MIQQIASVVKIINDLNFNEIPQLIVLNKTDLLKRAEIASLTRQITLDTDARCVSISAIRRESLRPIIEAIGELIVVPDPNFQGLSEDSLAEAAG